MEPTSRGLLKVVAPDNATSINPPSGKKEEMFTSRLASHIIGAFESAREHRQTEGIEEQLLHSLRTFRGEYSASTLQKIGAFQGSKVYARITAAKCRGASAILKDIYIGPERPWSLSPTPSPSVPPEVYQNVMVLVSTEAQTMQMNGQPVDEAALKERIRSLTAAADKAAMKQAIKATAKAQEEIDDLLTEGGFYEALQEFLMDLPVFPYACIKGPVVRMSSELKWAGGEDITLVDTPKMFWDRVSPFDLWFSPGASSIENSTVMERIRLTRSELYDLIPIPGYNEEEIREVLEEYSTGSASMSQWTSYFETERAALETRENPNEESEGKFIDTLEYHGYVKGKWLIDWGISKKSVKDPEKEYYVTAWLINNCVIKVQINPNSRQRSIYYVTSFEKIPGSIVGQALPQILVDIQDVANATLRALVNNLAIASGPQVIIDDERMAPNADKDSLYPWKRWHTESDPVSNNQPAVQFFQPHSNAAELLSVYKEFTNMADELSAIPRYLTGSQRTGGAASTASGLAMLMNNSSKVMQSIVSTIDSDILRPVLTGLYDMLLFTKSAIIRGDENIVVKGVTNAVQREQDRVRQLEFLQMTSNPIDSQILGPVRRAKILRAVSKGLGISYEDTVPSDEELEAQVKAAQEQTAAQEGGGQPGQMNQGQVPGPDEARSDAAGPRMDNVSNRSTM